MGEGWFWKIASRFGEALTIASIIGFFLDITEIRHFFEKRLTNVLFGDEYIGTVSEDRLITLSEIAINGIAERYVNNSAYDYGTFVTSVIADVVLENIGQIYRENFTETTYHSELSSDEIGELGLNAEDPTMDLIHLTIKTAFQLIAPMEDEDQEFDLSECCRYDVEVIRGLEDKQFQFTLLVNGEIISIDLSECVQCKTLPGTKPERELLSFECKYKVPFKSIHGYTASVNYIIDVYQYDLRGRFKKNMNTLTKGATILFSSKNELELDAEFFGLTGYSEPSITLTSIFMQYKGWALPEDGYFISWREKSKES